MIFLGAVQAAGWSTTPLEYKTLGARHNVHTNLQAGALQEESSVERIWAPFERAGGEICSLVPAIASLTFPFTPVMTHSTLTTRSRS